MRHITGLTVLAFVVTATLLVIALQGAVWRGAPTSGQAKIVVVGDLMLGRYVGASLQNTGYDSAFAGVKDFLSEADLAVGNLEGPLVPPGTFVIPTPSVNQPSLTGDALAARSIARAGFDLLSLANNHSLDAGQSGFLATADSVKTAGMQPLGMEENGYALPVVRDVRGLKIAFLAYTLIAPNQARATGASSDPAYFNPADPRSEERMGAEIRSARQASDTVIVVMHWGTEYAAQPDATQKQFAKIAAEAGADIVVGAHPHVAQGAELIRSGARSTFVAYSLGNALFDQNSRPETTGGLALEVTIDREGVRSARLVPLEITRVNGAYAMSLAGEESGQATLKRADLSTAPDLKWQGLSDAHGKPESEIANNRTPTPTYSEEDLGMAGPSQVTLDNGTLSVNGTDSGKPVEWRTEPGWRVTSYTVGDADGDGRPELIYTLWKPRLTWERPPEGGMSVNQEGGEVLPHIYINGWRKAGDTWAMRPVWHGSPRPAPMLAVAVAPIGEGGKPVLASLDSADPKTEKAPGTIHIWQWTGGFGFELVSTLPGKYSQLWSDGKTLLFR